MNLILTLEHRFSRTPDGRVWTEGPNAYPLTRERYLAVFDTVRVVARVRPIGRADQNWQRADGERVSFAAVPYYLGPWQYLRRARRVRRAVWDAVGPEDAVILRVPSQIANCLEPFLRRTSHPYGVHVVGDPYDVFAPNSVRHLFRPFFRWWFTRQLCAQCRGACAASYVTKAALQRRYPTAAYTDTVSDVELPDAAFAPAPRPPRPASGPLTLVTVGSLAQMYKAPDVLIDAVAACVRGGLDLRLVFVGDGKFRPQLEERAAAAGLTDRVEFLGQLPAGAAVRAQVDRADLFVLPSKTEGLPRAMIEAMARAVPCVGSTVGGIPELLPPDDLVPPGDVPALAAKIRQVLGDPDRLVRMSAEGLRRAREFGDAVLSGRRIDFYRHVRRATEDWLRTRQGDASPPSGEDVGRCHVGAAADAGAGQAGR